MSELRFKKTKKQKVKVETAKYRHESLRYYPMQEDKTKVMEGHFASPSIEVR
nr:MAG TPA: hypothetical protein [Caudoviricetes sp.]